MKIERLAQVLSYEFCQVFMNIFSHETPVVAASACSFAWTRTTREISQFPDILTLVWEQPYVSKPTKKSKQNYNQSCYCNGFYASRFCSMRSLKSGKERWQWVCFQNYTWPEKEIFSHVSLNVANKCSYHVSEKENMEI